jgi:hypothetical protein
MLTFKSSIMNKKILLLAICFTMINSFMFGQAWKIGGNPNADVPLTGGEFGTNGNRFVIFETNGVERGRLENGTGFWRLGAFDATDPNARVHINSPAGEDPFRVTANGTSVLYVNKNGGVSVGLDFTPPSHGLYVWGYAGLGTTDPQTRLHVTGGTDASLGGGGYITTGVLTSTNIALDDNEIMARDNGAAANFFINHNGGNVFVDDAGSGGLAVGTTTTPPAKGLRVQGNIVGSGNIDVSGYVGFGSVETFSDGGNATIQSNSDLVPDGDNSHNVGTGTRTWHEVHAQAFIIGPLRGLSTAET